MTNKEKEIGYDTFRHIERVRNLMGKMIVEILNRCEKHDQSKLVPPESEVFAEYTEKLANTTYGSEEYKQFLKDMKPALDHHYAKNSHHPEFYKNGIKDMDIIDILEMLCDWKAASERHNDGNINKSIEINGRRFNMSQDLICIFENSTKYLK